MNWVEYRNYPALNASTLVAGRKSMKHLKRRIDDGFGEPTSEMRFGSMVHCLVLEPDEFDKRYVSQPAYELDPENVTGKGDRPKSPKATAYYKRKVAEFQDANTDREIVTQVEIHTARKVASVVLNKPCARMWIDDCEKEVSLFGEIEGVPCKSRLDLYGKAILDLKITQTVSPRLFWDVFHRLGYGFRLAFYREIARQNCGRDLDVKIIAAEPDGDYDCVVFEIPDELLDQELEHVKRLTKQYKQCRELNSWPGVDGDEDYMPLHIPNWYMGQEEVELEWA